MGNRRKKTERRHSRRRPFLSSYDYFELILLNIQTSSMIRMVAAKIPTIPFTIISNAIKTFSVISILLTLLSFR